MAKLIDHWSEARSDLRVDVVGPITIQITEGLTVHADILVRNFGGPKGTIGVEDFRAAIAIRQGNLGPRLWRLRVWATE